MADAASDELIAATDIADLLVRRGVPFRECHGIVAGLVRDAVTSGRQLSDFTPDELRAHSEHLDDGVAEVLAAVARGSSRRSARAGPSLGPRARAARRSPAALLDG